MKKLVPVFVNENSKERLETAVKKLIADINEVKTLCILDDGLKIADSKSLLDFMEKCSKGKTKEIESQYIKEKNREEYDKFSEQFSGISEEKKIELFTKEEQVKSIRNIITLIKNCKAELTKLSHTAKDITFDTLLSGEDFTYNTKVSTLIKNTSSYFCKNQKQVDTLRFIKDVKEVVERGLRAGIISKDRRGIVLEELIDTNTGDINSGRILSIQ